MEPSDYKMWNAAYKLHLIITILLALGGFAGGIAYAVIQENVWLLFAIWAGTFVVVGLRYVLGPLFLDTLADIKTIRDSTLKTALNGQAVKTSAPQATNSVAVTKTVADKLTQLQILLRDGKITQEFYEKEKARILSGYSGNANNSTAAPHATNSVAATKTVADKLTQLNTLLRDGKITQEFYEKEKARILSGRNGNENNSTAAPSVAKAADNAAASSTNIARQQKTLQLKAMLEKGAITQKEHEEKTKEYEKKMKETYTIE